MKGSVGHWVRFQKYKEREAISASEGATESDIESALPTGRSEVVPVDFLEPRSMTARVGKGLSAPSSSSRSGAHTGQKVITANVAGQLTTIAPTDLRSTSSAVSGPLLIPLSSMTEISSGCRVEALYGSELDWFPGAVTQIVKISPLTMGTDKNSLTRGDKATAKTIVEVGEEKLLYHVKFDDGDEELCSRAKIRVPQWKEKQPGILAISQVVHAESQSAGAVLRGLIIAGPFKKEGVSDRLIDGAGAGTGGGGGPEDEYDVQFYMDDKKEKAVIERVKRKVIMAPHVSASLVDELRNEATKAAASLTMPAAIPLTSSAVSGPLLIPLSSMTEISPGCRVEALYGSELDWFPGTVTQIVKISPLTVGTDRNSLTRGDKATAKTIVEIGEEKLLYHVKFDDGDEELCSRAKIRVPQWKEKQPGILAISQAVHAESRSAGAVLRGLIIAGPFKKEGVSDRLIDGAGAGTGGGGGPEDEYDVQFYMDDKKEKAIIERVKRKVIMAPHISASLVDELRKKAISEQVTIRKEKSPMIHLTKDKIKPVANSYLLPATPRNDSLVSLAVSRGEGPDHFLIAEVLRLDKHRRIIHAQLLHPTTLQFYTVELPYDHPRLVWFLYEPQDGDSSEEEVLEINQSVNPALADIGNGMFFISYPMKGREAERCGQVLSADLQKRTLSVYYQDMLNGLMTDIVEVVSYDQPGLSWYKDESLDVDVGLVSWVDRPKISEALGYLVEVRSLEPNAIEGDMFSGEIMKVNETNNTVLVSFDSKGEDDEDEDEDEEYIPYDSLDIAWVAPPLYLRSKVPRPSIALAPGYLVGVYSDEQNVVPRRVVKGKVLSCQEDDGSMCIRFFDGESDEIFPYDSLQVAWIEESDTFSSRSIVPRPSLSQATGYAVEVHSRDQDVKEGHAFVGKVISVDRTHNTVKIHFETIDGDGDEEEPDCDDYPFLSSDIAWMREPVNLIHSGITAKEADRDSDDGALSIQVKKEDLYKSAVSRPPINRAVGYEITAMLGDGHEPLHGIVSAVDMQQAAIFVKIKNTRGVLSDAILEKGFDYMSTSLCWIKSPSDSLLTRSKVPRPPLSQTVGYEVDVKSTEDDADPDDVFIGVISTFNIVDRTVHIIFKGQDGEADEESLQYDSTNISWMKAPWNYNSASMQQISIPLADTTTSTTTTSVAASADIAEGKKIVQVKDVGTQRLDLKSVSHESSGQQSVSTIPQESSAVTTAVESPQIEKLTGVSPSRVIDHPPLKKKKRPVPVLPIYKKWDSIESKKATDRPVFDDVVGRYIAITDDGGDIKGKVIGKSKKMLQIQLLDEIMNMDEEVLELKYNSPSIRWYEDI